MDILISIHALFDIKKIWRRVFELFFDYFRPGDFVVNRCCGIELIEMLDKNVLFFSNIYIAVVDGKTRSCLNMSVNNLLAFYSAPKNFTTLLLPHVRAM